MKPSYLNAVGLALVATMLLTIWPVTWSGEAVTPWPSDQLRNAAGSITPMETTQTVLATGTLNASVTIEVGSQLSGRLAVIAADFNDVVKKDQLLAQLDDARYQAEVDAAKASLESAKVDERIAAAHLERAYIEVTQIEMQRQILEIRVEKARIAVDNATREMKRKAVLSDHKVASEAEVLNSSARSDTARAALREAQVELENHANAGGVARCNVSHAEAELEKARTTVKQLEAQLHAAMVDLDRTSIRSPIDGVIIGRNVTQGQTLATALEARTLFVVAADLRELDIWAKLDESDIAKIALGQNATYTVDSFPGREFTAKVIQIRKAPQVVQNVVTYTVVLATRNNDYALLPGMTVVVRIKGQPATASEKMSSALPASSEVGIR